MFKHLFVVVIIILVLVSCKKNPNVSAEDTNAIETLLASANPPFAIQGSVYFFGDSITYGYTSGVYTTGNWVSLVSAFTGCNGKNLGIGGTTLERVVNNVNMPTAMYNRAVNEIPVKNADDKYLVFAYGVNDIGFNYSDTNPDQFSADYQYIINIAFSRGWPAKNIILVNAYYCNDKGYRSYLGYGVSQAADKQRTNLFNNAIANVAQSNGLHVIDIYTFMLQHGAEGLLSPDGLHPSEVGYSVIARGIEAQLRTYQ